MIKDFKKPVLYTAASTLLVISSISMAIADQRCRSTDLTFVNNVTLSGEDEGVAIKVTKVKYYDREDKKWRTSNIPNEKIPIGGTSGVIDETLEYVGNEQIRKFKAEYQPCTRHAAGDPNDCTRYGAKHTSDAINAFPGVTGFVICIRDREITIPVEDEITL